MLYLVPWYRGCAADSKPAEVGSSPTGITRGNTQVRFLHGLQYN